VLHDGALGLGAVHGEDVVRQRRDRRLGGVHRVRGGHAQEPLHDLVHPVIEGRGEEQPLPARRRRGEQPPHAGQEAEVGHVVGLVEDGDLDVVEGQQLLTEQILEAP